MDGSSSEVNDVARTEDWDCRIQLIPRDPPIGDGDSVTYTLETTAMWKGFPIVIDGNTVRDHRLILVTGG